MILVGRLLLEVWTAKRLFLLTAGGKKKTEKGKQVKQAQKLSDAHTHLYPQLNLNRRMLLISHYWIAWQLGFRISPVLTLKGHFVDLTCESAAIFFELSIWVKVWNGRKTLKLQARRAHSTLPSLPFFRDSRRQSDFATACWRMHKWPNTKVNESNMKMMARGEKENSKNTLPEFVIQHMHLCFLKVWSSHRSGCEQQQSLNLEKVGQDLHQWFYQNRQKVFTVSPGTRWPRRSWAALSI